jgi:hypothetical protein
MRRWLSSLSQMGTSYCPRWISRYSRCVFSSSNGRNPQSSAYSRMPRLQMSACRQPSGHAHTGGPRYGSPRISSGAAYAAEPQQVLRWVAVMEAGWAMSPKSMSLIFWGEHSTAAHLVAVEQQVLWLEVAVHKALAVAIRHRRHNLAEERARLGLLRSVHAARSHLEPVASNNVVEELPSRRIFKHEKILFVCFNNLKRIKLGTKFKPHKVLQYFGVEVLGALGFQGRPVADRSGVSPERRTTVLRRLSLSITLMATFI